MAKRGVRVMLWVVILLVLATTAYFFWIDESATRRDTTAARAFDDSAGAASRALIDVRVAQQAYVATGQGDDFWGSRVAASLSAARQALGTMHAAISPDARVAIESASTTLTDFEQMDRRAREYLRSGQHLLAADIIFSDGLEMTEAALAEVQRARTAEQRAVDAMLRTVRQRQWIALAAGGVAIGFLTLLLVPVPRARADTAAAAADPDVTPPHAGLDLRPALDADELRWTPPARSAPAMAASSTPAPPQIDLTRVAALCGDLARATDTRSLPPILERTAGVLDAAGIVLWIADPDGRELTPILAHGYSSQLVMRLGTLPRDAENVTAAAFRTALVQTLKADAVSNGAIAAPLVTPAGCVGVMAAEVRNGGEQQDGRVAAAAIVAAQLATLVGPPVARKAEAAGG
jgi:hypothetical protein